MNNAFGKINEEALHEFSEAYDFKTCERSDGTTYGTNGDCSQKGAKEVKESKSYMAPKTAKARITKPDVPTKKIEELYEKAHKWQIANGRDAKKARALAMHAVVRKGLDPRKIKNKYNLDLSGYTFGEMPDGGQEQYDRAYASWRRKGFGHDMAHRKAMNAARQ